MRGQLRIDQMFAVTMIDDDGTEGVVAVLGPDDTWIPLVGADMARLESVKAMARASPFFVGRKLTVLRFGEREEIDVIDRTAEQS